MKQLGLAVMQYSQDYDEQTVPRRIYVNSSTRYNFAWSDIIQPYLKNTQVLVCPSSVRKAQSIAYNASIGSSFNEPVSTSTPYPIRLLSGFPIPSETVQFTDCVGMTGLTDSGLPASPVFSVTRGSAGGDVLGRIVRAGSGDTGTYDGWPYSAIHLEGANYLFVDGHVKWLIGEKAGVTRNAAPHGSTVPSGLRPDGVNWIGPKREGVSYNGIEVGTGSTYN